VAREILEERTFVVEWEKSEGSASVALAASRSEPAARRALRDLSLPSDILAVTLTVLGFFIIALAIASLYGIGFTAPRPGKIPGLDANYWAPPIIAAVAYLAIQVVGRQFGRRNRPSWAVLGRRIFDDYYLLALFIFVIYVHFNIKMWIPVVNPALYDEEYFAVDQALRPLIDLFAWLRAWGARIIPATDIWYQAAFFAVFVLSYLTHSIGDRRWHYHNMIGLLLIEMVGPLSYLFAPAVGPFIFEQGPNVMATNAELTMYEVYKQVLAGGAAWVSEHGGQYFAQPLAAMPSLHVGATFVIVYYSVKARQWVSPLAVLAFAWIVIESVVARWHYLIDLPVGLLLAAGVIFVTNRLCRPRQIEIDRAGAAFTTAPRG
jgi:hypothetical protein